MSHGSEVVVPSRARREEENVAKKPFTADPNWSLEQALAAAWEAYPTSGQQFGVTGRVRCLIQWANVAGVERATRELEDAVKRGVLHGEFSKSTIATLRKAFAGMPKREPAAPPRDLQHMLQWVAAQTYENEMDFLAKAVPPLARALGWGDDQMFFRTRLPGEIPSYADAVLAPARTSTPRVLIEAGLRRYQPGLRLHERLRSMMAASRADVGAFLSPEELVVVDARGEQGFSLASIGRADADQVQAMLGRRPGVAAEPEQIPAPGSADATFDALLQAVDDAATNDEKKKSLESLATALVKGLPSWRCKYTNLVTRSAEIDIVVEQVGDVPTALSEFGRYALVECKNWSKPVDAKHIRDFIGKMRNANVRLGIVFSTKGVTGEGHGTDALREVQQAYSKERIAVVVISRDDFRACADSGKFLALVDERLDALRFDM
jgi:hypothetical protein